MVVVKENGDSPIKPVLLKFGVAVAISLGGILYTYLRAQNVKAPKSKSSQGYSGNGRQADTRGESDELRDENYALPVSFPRKVSSQNSISGHSSSGWRSGDRDGFLLPEFNELVKECNIAISIDDVSPKKNGDCPVPDAESPREYKSSEHDEHEREIRGLQGKVKILEERERNLEIQLLEYYGIKEQETAVMELRNRLKLNNMEAKLYNLKIESLLSDNKRLEAQVADYAKVVAELEAAKAKIKLLRKKLKSEAEQNREQILTLQDRVMKLQDQEQQKAVEINQDLEMQLKRRMELEEDLEKMKKSNQSLKMENSDLAQKLEYVQMLARSALDNEEVAELKEESHRLKQQNEDLRKEIERLQTGRSTDMEELVYLRWINASLRHQLRSYQPSAGKTNARDLSRTPNPKSDEKANSHKENCGEKGMDVTDIELDRCSLSQASCVTDSGERDDLFVDTSPANKTGKTKVFAKLRKLLKGKGSNRNNQPQPVPLQRTVSVDNITGRYSSPVVVDGGTETFGSSSGCSSRRSFDLPRSYSRSQKSLAGGSSNCSQRTSDDGSSSILRRINSLTEDDDWSPAIQPDQDAQNAEKNDELLKCAEALKNSHSESFRRRSASFASR